MPLQVIAHPSSRIQLQVLRSRASPGPHTGSPAHGTELFKLIVIVPGAVSPLLSCSTKSKDIVLLDRIFKGAVYLMDC